MSQASGMPSYNATDQRRLYSKQICSKKGVSEDVYYFYLHLSLQ
jgi:hypothetical protein